MSVPRSFFFLVSRLYSGEPSQVQNAPSSSVDFQLRVWISTLLDTMKLE